MPEVQTPLWELLADVPKDLRIGVETPNPLGSDVQWIPVGQLCAQASEELARAARATDQGPVAWLPPDPPPECKSEAEKTAFAFGWFKALESRRTATEETVHLQAAAYANKRKEAYLDYVKKGLAEKISEETVGWVWVAHYEGYRDALQETSHDGQTGT